MEYWLKGSMPTYGGYKCSKCSYQTMKYALSRCPSCKSPMYTKYVGYKNKPKNKRDENQGGDIA